MKLKRTILPKANKEEVEQIEKEQKELLRVFRLREKSPLFEFDKEKHKWVKKQENLNYDLWLKHRPRGENHHWYKHGLTSLILKIRDLHKFRLWKSDVLTRDNHTCQYCGNQTDLHTHHIVSVAELIQKYEIANTKQANDCAELWNINNGVTLCGECHRKLHQGEIEL